LQRPRSQGFVNVNVMNNTILMNGLAPIGAPWGTKQRIGDVLFRNVKMLQNSLRDAACSANSPASPIIVGGSSMSDLWKQRNNIAPHLTPAALASSSIRHRSPDSIHNNLVNNSVQASDDNPGKNQWVMAILAVVTTVRLHGVDSCSGPQQNICPARTGLEIRPTRSTPPRPPPLMGSSLIRPRRLRDHFQSTSAAIW